MHRFFLENEDYMDEKHIKIFNPSSLKHMTKVLRLKLHESVEFVNNEKCYIAKALAFASDSAEFEVESSLGNTTESPIQVDLFQCLPKSTKMEYIIQKNVEMGIRRFYFVQSKRSVVQWNEKDFLKKKERFDKIAQEAAKQSKRMVIPCVESLLDIKDVPQMAEKYDLFLVLYENERAQSLKKAIRHASQCHKIQKIGLLIGPEGGLESSEIEMMQESKIQIVTLGPRILRTETAGLIAHTCLQYELNGLE